MIRKLLRALIPSRFRPSGHIEYLARINTRGFVRTGPFAGMRYISSENDDVHIAKLLGTYERELNPYIEAVCASNFPLIVDIGAAEGYYAVGLALRNPKARVIAFEAESKTRSELMRKVMANDVSDRVEMRGQCEPQDLEQSLANGPKTFVLCDVEGYEARLLDPFAVPSLQRASILVELHEFNHRGISDLIRKRFVVSHKIVQIWQQGRNIEEFPFSDFYTRCLPKTYLQWAVGESRPSQMSWFWMEPRAIGNATP